MFIVDGVLAETVAELSVMSQYELGRYKSNQLDFMTALKIVFLLNKCGN